MPAFVTFGRILFAVLFVVSGAMKLINLAAVRPEAAAEEMDEALAWGCQLEIGPSASSLIPTAGEAAERAADIVTFDPMALSRPAGALRLSLPRGGVRGGTILDTAEGGIRLFYTDSGWLAATTATA